MSKIICDVCGTSYPETVTQCPICGCVRSVDAKVVAGSTNEAENQAASTYTYVKGGRFSKSNVKKRNNGNKQTASAEDNVQPAQPVQNEGKKDTGVIITTIVLLLAIVAVVVYIAMRFFAPSLSMGEKPDNNSNTAETTLDVTDNTDDTTETTLLEIPCTEVVLSKTLVEFDEVGQSLLLNVTLTPEDTTEDILFATSDESVVTINNDGKLTAMGGGEAIITVICGNVVAECNVICNIEVPTVETEPSAPSADDFKLNREDFTMTQKGQIWKLYSGDIAANQITWTSDNENIVTIKDGIVTAVGSGTTKVHGEYGGVKVSCIVRCSAAVGTADSGSNNTENKENNRNHTREDAVDKHFADVLIYLLHNGACILTAFIVLNLNGFFAEIVVIVFVCAEKSRNLAHKVCCNLFGSVFFLDFWFYFFGSNHLRDNRVGGCYVFFILIFNYSRKLACSYVNFFDFTFMLINRHS